MFSVNVTAGGAGRSIASMPAAPSATRTANGTNARVILVAPSSMPPLIRRDDETADRLRDGRSDALARKHGVERVTQIVHGHDLPRTAEGNVEIVDPPATPHRTVSVDDHCFRCHRRVDARGQ